MSKPSCKNNVKTKYVEVENECRCKQKHPKVQIVEIGWGLFRWVLASHDQKKPRDYFATLSLWRTLWIVHKVVWFAVTMLRGILP
jgi:hypothetical protein